MALATPFVSTFADRYPRKRVMIYSDLYCAVLVTAATLCLYAGHPGAAGLRRWPILTASAARRSGPPRAPITPQLANTTEELTASNGTASTLESLAIFVGPAIGGRAARGRRRRDRVPPERRVVPVVDAAWSSGIRVGQAEKQAEEEAEPESLARRIVEAAEEVEKARASSRETSAGFRTIWRDKDLLVTVVEGSAQTVVAGATAVFPLVMAVEILHTGAKGVGLLDSVLGLAAILGGIFAIARASKHKLGQDLIVGVFLWSFPLILVTIWPTPVAAFAVMAFLGFANPLVDVNVFTIMQRLTPDAVLGRVFGAFETCLIGHHGRWARRSRR